MLINKTDNNYIIKLLNTQINVYNQIELQNITKKIIKKINNKSKLNNSINLEFYTNQNYGTIIKLKDYKSTITFNNDKTVKITVHTDTPFLYQIDYFNIDKKELPKEKIYYYKNKFYIQITNKLTTKEYYKLLEQSEIIYEDTFDIIDKAIKI